MSTLPYEKTSVVDYTRGIASATPVASLNIASIIESDTGPVEIISVNNQKELIDNYCTGSLISALDNTTIQFNGALLTKARVDIVRADTSSIRVGKGSLGTTMYFDNNQELLDEVTTFRLNKKDNKLDKLWVILVNEKGQEVKYGIGDIEDDTIDLANGEPVEVTIKNFFNLLYKRGACLFTSDNKAVFISKISSFSDNLYVKDYNGNPYIEYDYGSINRLYSNIESNVDNSTSITIGSYTYYKKNSMSINSSEFINPIELSYNKSEFPSSVFLMLALHDLLSNNRIINPIGVSVKAVLGNEVEGYQTVINDLDEVYKLILKSENSKDNIRITDAIDETRGPSIYFKSINCPVITLADTSGSINFEAPTKDQLFEVNHATDETNDYYFTESSCYVVVDDTCYYSGSEVPSINDVTNYVLVSKDDLSVLDFIEELFKTILTEKTIGRAKYNNFIMDGSHLIKVSDNIALTNYQHIDQTDHEDSFAIVTKFTSNEPLFNYSYKKLNDEFDTLELTYKFKGNQNTIKFSFDGNAMNDTGSSLFYEKYNSDPDYKNNYISIVKLTGDKLLPVFESGDFGNEVLNNPITEATYTEAILKYLKTKDKQYQFITDAGHSSVALANACKKVADAKFAQYVPSIPTNYKKVGEIRDYVSSLALNDYRCYYLVPAHKSNYNGNFMSTMPASLSYMFARINAFNSVSGEFNPLFGSRKGVVSAPNLVEFYDDDEAQKLADLNINVITKDSAGTYIRSNFTSLMEPSYLCEDQNSYMTNILAQICEKYNPNIIAETNTKPLRDQVIIELTNRINERMISSKNPTLANYKIVCDESNNTLEIIEARQLVYEVWVQYNPSVAYVLAYAYVKRLGSF